MMMPLTRVSNSLQRWSLCVSLTSKSRLRSRRPSSFPGGNSSSPRKTKSLASRPNDLNDVESSRIPFSPVNEIDFGPDPVFRSLTYDCLNAFLLEHHNDSVRIAGKLNSSSLRELKFFLEISLFLPRACLMGKGCI